MTLESLAPSAKPALCPPTGTTLCERKIIQAVGNFSAYTNKQRSDRGRAQVLLRPEVPIGTVYMLKPNGKTVVKLVALQKDCHRYNTPCIEGPEQVLGSASLKTLYAQDTLYFTGVDPVMGRR